MLVNFLHRLPLHVSSRGGLINSLRASHESAPDIRRIFAGLYGDEIDVDLLRDKVSRVQQRLRRNFDLLMNFNKNTNSMT